MSEDNKICLSDLLYATKHEQGGYKVTYYNGVDLGTLEYENDGYLYYWPTNRKGFWTANAMREIANLLDHLNESWDKEIQQTFNK